MGNTRNTGYLQNAIKVSDAGAISFMSGSTMLATINTSGQMSGSAPVLFAATASFVANAQTASFVALAVSASNAVSAQTASFANAFTVASTLTAQTLVVQTITSSVDFVTGSTRFGSIAANTHTFTGSVLTSGSISIGTTSTTHRLNISTPSSSASGIQITKAGVLTSFLGDGGSEYPIGVLNLYDSGSQKVQIYAGSVSYFTGGNVGIRTTTPQASLHIAGLAEQNALTIGASNGYEIFITGSDSANIYHASPNQAIYLNTNGGPLHLGTSAASTLLTVTGSNVGIGVTNPYVTLDVRGGGIGQTTTDFVPSSAGSVIYMRTGATTGNTTYGLIQVGNTGDTTGGNLVLNQFGGNVGIGITSPTATLQVRGPNAVGTFFDAQNLGAGGAVFSRINASSAPFNQYVFNNGNVGIGRTPLAQLAVLGGAVQIMGDYPNWQTIIKSAGANGTFTGQLTITIPQMSDGNVDGYGGYSCEVYVAGFEGWYCHAWFSGYINGGITSSEATILRSNGGWSISQASFGANNQGFQFVVNYPTPYIVHPTARIIFNKGGSPNSFEYPANSITAVFS
jgi:hypothetical protein